MAWKRCSKLCPALEGDTLRCRAGGFDSGRDGTHAAHPAVHINVRDGGGGGSYCSGAPLLHSPPALAAAEDPLRSGHPNHGTWNGARSMVLLFHFSPQLTEPEGWKTVT